MWLISQMGNVSGLLYFYDVMPNSMVLADIQRRN